MAHIAGKVCVCRKEGEAADVKGRPVHIRRIKAAQVPVDMALELLDKGCFLHAGERRHVCYIHPRPFTNGQGQGFFRGVHMGDGGLGADGAPGEHGGLMLKFPLLIQHFQGAKQGIGGVIPKGRFVAPAGDAAILLHKPVIQGVELFLLLAYAGFRVVFQLILHKPAGAFPKADHGPYAGQGGGRGGGGLHLAIHPIVEISF